MKKMTKITSTSIAQLIKTYADLINQLQNTDNLESHDIETIDYGFGVTAVKHTFNYDAHDLLETYTVRLVTDTEVDNEVEVKVSYYNWLTSERQHYHYTVEK